MKTLIISFTFLISINIFAAKKYTCSTEGISKFESGIDVVELIVTEKTLTLSYRYDYSNAFYTEFSDNNDAALYHEYRDNQILFGFDSETYGKLASFDKGQTYEGRAVVSQDFDLFLRCK